MARKNKNVGYHFITLVLILMVWVAIADEVSAFFKNLSFASLLKALGFLVTALFGIFQLTESLTVRRKYGLFYDYLRFVRRTYFAVFPLPNVDIPLEKVGEKTLRRLAIGVRDYCNGHVNRTDNLGLREIIQLPFKGQKVSVQGVRSNIPPKHDSLVKELTQYFLQKKAAETPVFITGEPGAGKSFLLKQLAITLSDADEKLLPVYLPISTWRPHQTILQWAVETATDHYLGVDNEDIIEGLLQNNYSPLITPVLLLDGLDELKPEQVDDFMRQVLLQFADMNFVVSSRTELFDRLVKDKIVSLGHWFGLRKLDESFVKKTLCEQPDLPQLANVELSPKTYQSLRSPLLLDLLVKVLKMSEQKGKKISRQEIESDNFMDTLWENYFHLAYKYMVGQAKVGDTSVPGLNQKVEGEVWPDLFDVAKEKASAAKIEQTKAGPPRFKEDDLKKYAANLAWRTRSESNFTIGELQPNVLDTPTEKSLYALVSRLLIGTVISIGLGFTMSGPFDFLLPGLLGGFVAFCIFIAPFKPLKKTNTIASTPPPNLIQKTLQGTSWKVILSLVTYGLAHLAVFSLYFMSTGLRAQMSGFFATHDFNLAIFFALMFALLLGMHDLRHGFGNDIKVVERRFDLRHFDLPGAFRTGLIFMLLCGLGVYFLAVLFTKTTPNNFFSNWLSDTSKAWEMDVFFVVLVCILPIALVMGVLVGLNNPKKMRMDLNEKRHQSSLKYSIRNTMSNSLRLALSATLLMVVVWSWVCMILFKNGWDSGNKGAVSALGYGVFVGLWWGWKDLIKLWVVRMILFFKGDTPFAYSKMLKDLETLGVLTAWGGNIKFTRDELKTYFIGKHEKHLLKHLKAVLPVLLVALSLALVIRVATRQQYYWQKSEHFSLKNESEEALRIEANQIYVLKDGQLEIKARGLMCAGRILGDVPPLGTQSGFFAMPLGETYNIHPKSRHGAVMLHHSRTKTWKAICQQQNVAFLANFQAFKWYADTLHVQKGDTIRLEINDIEWQNNSNQYRIKATHLPTSPTN